MMIIVMIMFIDTGLPEYEKEFSSFLPPHATGGLTNEKFEQLIDFTDKLWRAGGYNSKPQDWAWGERSTCECRNHKNYTPENERMSP